MSEPNDAWTKFAHLEVPSTFDPLPYEIVEKWVKPLYFGLNKPHVENFVRQHKSLITDDLIIQLLERYDWRPRKTAAYLCALTGRISFLDQMGRLLLRSDVCCAGSTYCMALAEFNTSESIYFLTQYLDYYLTKTDLWFDQNCAMGAVAYLDKINSTRILDNYHDPWTEFVKNKPHWNQEMDFPEFEKAMELLQRLKRL